jgi:pimeloyl-ACP methyl ester carboxylesterase
MAVWAESTIEIAGTKIHVTRGGKGAPALVLHRDTGTIERSSFHDELAKSADVIVPHHPGWGHSARPGWMRSVRDVAVMHRGLLAELGIEQAALIGLGFGGWIAAEMATMAPGDVARLVLVGPMGIKPSEGDILDQAIISYIDYARAGFHDQKRFDKIYGGEPSTDQLEAWDIAREDNKILSISVN